MDVSDCMESQLTKMSGNGMSLPCAGFVMLMAVLCLEDVREGTAEPHKQQARMGGA